MSHRPAPPAEATWLPLVERALAEDLGPGDATSRAVIPAAAKGEAVIEARESLVVCGLPVVEAVFRRVDPSLQVHAERAEGERVAAGAALATLAGPVRSLLAGERTALNFLGRLCGIATRTRRYVDAVAGTRAHIVDTRKTLPGWRTLDKYAVAVGGGWNHRMGLFDALLVKDNHVAAAGGVEAATRAARAHAPPHLHLQVEVESAADAERAAQAGADSLLLDNLPPETMAEIVARLGERLPLEASGGITLDTVRAVAETGVHRISVGDLTHSAPCADVALEMRPDGGPEMRPDGALEMRPDGGPEMRPDGAPEMRPSGDRTRGAGDGGTESRPGGVPA